MNIFKQPDQFYQVFKNLKEKVIILEGNIGVGKTSLGNSIEKYLNSIDIPCKFFKEFVNEKLLGQYVNNMEKYSYTYELMMLTTRIFIYKAAVEYAKSGGVAVIDRSIIGDYAFGYLQKKRGYISEDEWDMLIHVLEGEKLMEPDCIIFLNCDPDVAYKRTCSRNSEAEKNYDPNYFVLVKEAYDVAMQDIVERRGIHKSIPHLHLNWNNDKEVNLDESLDSELEEDVHNATCILLNPDVINLLVQVMKKIKETDRKNFKNILYQLKIE